MQCPIDGAELLMAERQGVEIDYCPTCRGIWLDRGESDKIIEHVESGGGDRREGRDYDDEEEGERGSGRKRGRLSSFFEGFGD
jgi:Zn-finger nucleic acid-binding protein